MTDVDTRPPIFEVEWLAGTWTDESAKLLLLDFRHGATSTSNPDRPTVEPLTGSARLSGADEADATSRFRWRARTREASPTVLGSGLMQEPLTDPGPGGTQTTQWRLTDDLARAIELPMAFSRAGSTLADLLSDESFWSASSVDAPVGRGLPTRTFAPIKFDGRSGGWLSSLAAASSAQIAATRSGGLALTRIRLTTAPDDAKNITGAANRIARVTSKNRIDRIRNSATVEVTVRTAGEAEQYSVPLVLRVGTPQSGSNGFSTISRLSGGIPEPSDGRTYTDWSAVVVARIGVPTRAVYVGGGFGNGSGWLFDQSGWLDVEATVAVGEPDEGRRPVTVDIPTTSRPSWTQSVWSTSRGRYIESTLTWDGTLWQNDTELDPGGAWAYEVRADVDISAIATAVVEVPGSVTESLATASIGAWGERQLYLPDWVVGSPSTAQADLDAILAEVSELRREHTIALPVTQPTPALTEALAEIDAGEYATVDIGDTVRQVDISAACLVAGRRVTWQPGKEAEIELRVIETGATASTAAPGLPRNVGGTALSATSIRFTWDAPNSGGSVSSYSLRFRRTGTDDGWTTRTDIAGTSRDETGLTRNTSYDVQVRADGPDASSDWTATVAVSTASIPAPGLPRNVGGTALSTTSIRFTWDAPNSGGRVSSYSLRFRRTGTMNWTTRTGITGTSRDETGLVQDTQYDVQVRAVGPDASSDWTATAEVRTAAPEPAPGPVRNLSATAQSSTAIGASWDAPNTGGRVLSYRVRYRANSSGTWSVAAAAHTATSIEITGLDAETEYQIEVRANGPVANSTVETTTAQTNGVAPAAPTGLAVASASGQLTLTWDAAAGATGYDVDIDGAGQVDDLTNRTHTFTGLDNGTQYTLRVRATNSWGDSPWAAINGTPAAAVPPGTPTGLAAAATGPTAIAVSWTAPSDVGDGITRYRVQYRAGTSGAWTGEITATATSADFTGLAAESTHSYRVRAEGPGGFSAYTAAVSATTDTNEPGVPTDVAAVVQNQGLDLTWGAPATGGAPTNYDVRIGGGTWTALASNVETYSWTGLTNGQEYTLEVRARNASGSSAPVLRRATPRVLVAPGVPTGLTLVAASDSSLTISWDAPADAGDGITDYQAQLREASYINWVDADEITPDAAGEHAFTGLTAETEYDGRVRSRGRGGNSDWTDPVSATTDVSDDVPVPPDVRFDDRLAGSGYVRAAWGAPPAYAGHIFNSWQYNWRRSGKEWEQNRGGAPSHRYSNYYNFRTSTGAVEFRIRCEYTKGASRVHSEYVMITYQPTTFFTPSGLWLALADDDDYLLPLTIAPLGRPMELT